MIARREWTAACARAGSEAWCPAMSSPQTTIAIVYDYDQTLSPVYMQDDVLFPAFGIDPKQFWARCHRLVEDEEFDNELAYLKVMLDYLDMDRPTNADLVKLGAKLQVLSRGAGGFPGTQ